MYGLCFVHELVPFSVNPYEYLHRFGFPRLRFEKQDFERLYQLMLNDKKAHALKIRFVVANGEKDFTLVGYEHEQLAQAYQQFLYHLDQSEAFLC